MGGEVELTNDAIYWRGLFIQRYAGIEFSLTHLLVAASLCREYADLGPPPFKLVNKLARLRAIMQVAPIQAHSGKLAEPLAYFESIEDSRHFFVHGVMAVKIIKDEPMCRFRLYQHRDGGFFQGAWDVPLAQFKDFSKELGEHSTVFIAEAARIARAIIPGST